MTKVNNIKVPDSIHSNINETYDFIDAHLPERYAREVLDILPENSTYSIDYIRQVKNNRRKSPEIMIALYRLAQWYKLQNEA